MSRFRQGARPRPQASAPFNAARLLRMAAAGLAGMAALALWLVVDWTAFGQAAGLWAQPVRSVSIEGPFRHISRERLAERLDGQLQGSLMTLDLDALRRTVLAEPWVERVSIRRHWPDRLEIRLTEQVPIAYWGDQALVNYRGERFRPDSIPVMAGLPVLLGPDERAADVMQRYRELNALFEADGLQVMRLEVDARQAWRIHVQPGIELVLGQGEVPEKLARLLVAWRAELGQHRTAIERIDLRYGNGLAVRWRDGHKPAAAVHTTGAALRAAGKQAGESA